MRKQYQVRPIGQCIECGHPATHGYECATCHVASLAIVAIKGKYMPYQLQTVAEELAKADLYAIVKDKSENGVVRHIAIIITQLTSGHGLNLHDVKRSITRRLQVIHDDYEQFEKQTDEEKAHYMSRVTSWLGTLMQHIAKKP